jgi:hypothetical protein
MGYRAPLRRKKMRPARYEKVGMSENTPIVNQTSMNIDLFSTNLSDEI